MSGSSGPDAFIPDAEFNSYINASLAEFHEIIVRNDVRFYLTSSQFTPTAGQQGVVPLPSDFMVADGLERSLDGSGNPGSWANVPKYQWRDRNYAAGLAYTGFGPPLVAYNIAANNLMLQPALNAAGRFQLWYYPTSPALVNDSDTFDDQRYWYEFVVVDVAIKALQKEESDTSLLQGQKQLLKQRIELMGSDRDFSTPEQIGRRGNGNGPYGMGNGSGGWGYGS